MVLVGWTLNGLAVLERELQVARERLQRLTERHVADAGQYHAGRALVERHDEGLLAMVRTDLGQMPFAGDSLVEPRDSLRAALVADRAPRERGLVGTALGARDDLASVRGQLDVECTAAGSNHQRLVSAVAVDRYLAGHALERHTFDDLGGRDLRLVRLTACSEYRSTQCK